VRLAFGGRGAREWGVNRVIHVLTGPTAVGKTELALRWAEARHAEIISCDSLLFYRGMDIGTAKPVREELSRVRHHLIDICEPAERMDVTRYLAHVRTVLADLEARRRPVLVTGGSGFYLRAFFAPVADDVPVDPEIRARIEAQWREAGLAALVEELRRLNPDGLGALDTANPRRVMRALERCLVSGRTLAELADAFARQPPPFAGWDVRCTRLERDAESLTERIERRVDAMLRDGLVDEVRRLLAVGLKANPSAAGAIGYRETIAMLEGELPPERLAEEISRNTRALVRKQRTWFRTQLPPHGVVNAATATVETLFT
jgi:tRNA dimethylallyltransferase